ncbi:hypothetical protein V8C42DRAFT_289477 [Trichoderma barbatum]
MGGHLTAFSRWAYDDFNAWSRLAAVYLASAFLHVSGIWRRMCASTSMIGISVDDPAQGFLKQTVAETCFMLLQHFVQARRTRM